MLTFDTFVINQICYYEFKFFTLSLKRMKLDIYAFDKIMFCIGKVQISLNRNKYNDIQDLKETEVKIFSQNGEDGIIDYLIQKLKIDNKNVINKSYPNFFNDLTKFGILIK